MTQFMLAHPYLFTFQVGFVSLVIASLAISIGSSGGKVGQVHHHYHNGGNENENKH
jgi:hypothetical protein